MRLALVLLALGQLVCLSPEAMSAEPDQPVLQKMVEQQAERYKQAFQARDAAALAKLFTPEAEYIDADGTVFHGRAAIEAEYAAHLALTPTGKLSIEIISIRPIATNVLVEQGVSTFRPDGDGIVSQVQYAAIHVQQADQSWLLASVRELGEPIVAIHERLKELGWLLGTWHEDVGTGAVSTTWKWTADGNFLISEFSIAEAGRKELSGTQRIGWDGERRQFHSWMFDTSGGALDGWWTENEDGTWSVRLQGVDALGGRISSLLTYAPDGADGLVLVQDQQSRNGESLPSVVRRLVRQPPAPVEKKTR